MPACRGPRQGRFGRQVIVGRSGRGQDVLGAIVHRRMADLEELATLERSRRSREWKVRCRGITGPFIGPCR